MREILSCGAFASLLLSINLDCKLCSVEESMLERGVFMVIAFVDSKMSLGLWKWRLEGYGVDWG